MIRVLLAVVGSAGDVFPFLSVGRHLTTRGLEVVMQTSPAFETNVRDAGLEFVPLGTREDYERDVRDPRLWDPRRAAKFMMREVLPPTVPEMAAFVEDQHAPGRTVVIGSTLAYGAIAAADMLDVPCVFMHLAPASMPSMRTLPRFGGVPAWLPNWLAPVVWRVADSVLDRGLAGPVNEVRARYGRPPVGRLMTGYGFRTPAWRIGMFPQWFFPPASDWPEQTELLDFVFPDRASGRAEEEEALPEDLEAFLSAEPDAPPIAVSMGTANPSSAGVYRAVIEAGARLGRRVIALTRFAEQLPRPLPAHALHVPYAPFGRVFPRCAAIVHHGGIGTLAQAMRAGVPQLIVPLAHDQFDNGAHVVRLGCGLSLASRKPNVSRLASRLTSLLASPDISNSSRSAASRLTEAAERTGLDRLEAIIKGSASGA